MTDQPRIRVKLKSFDHRVIDEAAKKIIQAALVSGAKVVGPVPLLPKRKSLSLTPLLTPTRMLVSSSLFLLTRD
jgi:small subunit ribosomal protein S10